MIKRIINKVLPLGSKRRKSVKKIQRFIIPNSSAILTPGNISYEEWIDKIEPLLFALTEEKTKKLKSRPLISIVVPCYNTPKKYIDPLIESVTKQIYGKWELCLADGSTNEQSKKMISALTKIDKRIRYIPIPKNYGIVGNTNIGLRQAKGKFVAFLDHDDTLSPYALAEMAIAINSNPSAGLLYSDEDKLSDDGKHRLLPFFKPDWSPELLKSVNYITHFVVARKDLVKKIGMLREGFNGAQDYDFLLRLTEKTEKIVHIPKILYHWRLADGSTAGDVGNKNYADDAGQKALIDYVKRNNISAEVLPAPGRPTNYRLKYKIPKGIKVSIIIPFKDKPELLDKLTNSIFDKTIYKNYEFILVSNNSVEAGTAELINTLKKHKKVKIFEYNKPFNYSALINFGRKQATGDVIVTLNNDMEIINQEWLEELVSNAMRPEVGVVGGWLTYPDGTTQHAGIVLGMGGMAGHVFRGRKAGEFTEFGMPDWGRNYLAVTGACQAMRAELFDKLGGYDEKLIICGSDVTICLKAHEKGYQNIYCPYVRLTHYESKSIVSYDNIPAGDYDRSLVFYKPYSENKDPYFNDNLDYMNESIGLGG